MSEKKIECKTVILPNENEKEEKKLLEKMNDKGFLLDSIKKEWCGPYITYYYNFYKYTK